MADAQRLFFALWPDEAAAQALHAQADRGLAVCGGRAMRIESLHLTLAFLGQVAADRLDELHVLGAAVALPAFTFRLDTLGYWQRNRILWAGCRVAPAQLQGLAAELRHRLDTAGIGYAAGEFVPHVTLLRDARCREAPPLDTPIDWTVREFCLVLSEPGAHYRPLARWAFR